MFRPHWFVGNKIKKSLWSFARVVRRDPVNRARNADHATRTCERFVYSTVKITRLLAINLCRLALGGQMVKNLRPNLSSTKVNASPRKSSQVDASPRKWVAKRSASWTQVQNLRRIASPFGQGLRSLQNVQGWHDMCLPSHTDFSYGWSMCNMRWSLSCINRTHQLILTCFIKSFHAGNLIDATACTSTALPSPVLWRTLGQQNE